MGILKCTFTYLISAISVNQFLGCIEESIYTLRYITLISLDPKFVTVTVGRGICHLHTKTYVQYN
jgi:hypothetical protein